MTIVVGIDTTSPITKSTVLFTVITRQLEGDRTE